MNIVKNPFAWIVGLTTIILFVFFGRIMISPNSYFFASDGDGIKNYFTPAYYVKYDSGSQFSGMNYPYGENMLFTDNQPILSYTLNFIDDYICSISDYTIGILNLLMLYSFVLCAICLFLILRIFKLPEWFAVITSVLIAFLSPQLFRLGGHYALAYAFFVPLLWLFVLKLQASRKPLKWLLIIAVYSTFFGFIHLYYLLMGSFFLLAYMLVLTFANLNKLPATLPLLFGLFIVAILPIAIVKGWLFMFDPVSDRPGKPYGLDLYLASFRSVFIPPLPPQSQWFDQFNFVSLNWEGLAYVGLMGLPILTGIVIRTVVQIFNKNFISIFKLPIPKPLFISLLAATLILFFSMGYPSVWLGETESGLFNLLRQFRSVGRFAWVFYFVFTVFSVYCIFHFYLYLLSKKMRFIGIGVLVASIGLYAFDAYTQVNYIANLVNNSDKEPVAKNFTNNQDNYSSWLSKERYRADDFQAILPIPFYLTGSELFDISGSKASLKESFKASLNTGLPIATMNMSRTSLTHAMHATQLLSSDYIYKDIIDRYPNKKPLLMVVTNDEKTSNEKRILSKGKIIFSNEQVSVYALPLTSINTSFSQIKDSLKIIGNKMIKMDWYKSYPMKPIFVYYDDFNTQTNDAGFEQSGSMYMKLGKLVCYENELPLAAVGQKFEVSFWVKADYKAEGLPVVYLERINKDGEVIETQELHLKISHEVYQNWIRAEFITNIEVSARKLKAYAVWRDIVIDNLLIRPVNTDVYYNFSSDSSRFTMNNYFIDLGKE